MADRHDVVIVGSGHNGLTFMTGGLPAIPQERLRGSILTVLCAWVAFAVAAIGFLKLVEYQAFRTAAREHTAVGVSGDVVVVAGLVSLLAVLGMGAALGPAVLQAARSNRGTWLLRLVIPLSVAAAGFVVYTLILLVVPNGRGTPASTAGRPDRVLFGAWIALGLVAVVLGTRAFVVAASRSTVSVRELRAAVAPAAVAAIAMAVMLGATLAWGLSVRSASPRLFHGKKDGLFGTGVAATWLFLVGLIAAATATAIVGAVRALRDSRDSGLPSRIVSLRELLRRPSDR